MLLRERLNNKGLAAIGKEGGDQCKFQEGVVPYHFSKLGVEKEGRWNAEGDGRCHKAVKCFTT